MNDVPDLHAHQLLMGIAGDSLSGRIHIEVLRALVYIDRSGNSLGKSAKQHLTLLKRLSVPFTVGNVTGVDYYLSLAKLVPHKSSEYVYDSPFAAFMFEAKLERD